MMMWLTFGVTAALAPHFERFADAACGRWRGIESERVVEEVMRSCGGAVQGIDEDGLYANRADDGFVYFDDGSWCLGRVDSPAAEWCLSHGDVRRRFSGGTVALEARSSVSTVRRDDAILASATDARVVEASRGTLESWIAPRVSWRVAKHAEIEVDILSRGTTVYPGGAYVARRDGVAEVGSVYDGSFKRLVRTFDEAGLLTSVALWTATMH